ncbi:MAG: IPT/TIG domain-containing protein, partial [Acidimicrobiales bacterium]
AATDTNTLDSFSVVNTDGGTAKSGVVELNIQPAPTITSVAPTTASANATTAFTLTGTNFAAGASVSATADGTCGVATVVSATSVTVSCTFGAATSAAALTLTNANGGVATSATVLASSTAPAGGAPHATGEAGSAIIGRTVDIAVAGVGFYGQPSVTSTGNSVKAVVSKDNGTLMTVRVTVGKTTGPGEHTLTFTLANGDVFKVNYAIIK